MFLYRLVMAMALPVLSASTGLATWRGRAGRGALAERLALEKPRRGATGPRLWLHGASLGELTSARWLIAEILAERPDLALIVTCNSSTGRQMVQGWGLQRCTVRLAPFDTPGVLRRFIAHWQLAALITLENEIWPERVAQAHVRGLPVLWIGARMSERSAAMWSRVAPRLIRSTLARMAFVSAQDEGSEQRLVSLGLPAAAIGPRLMLKARAGAAPAPAPPFAAPAPRAEILLAASTHEGEDEVILEAFQNQSRFRHLILAPRHPERAGAIRAAILQRGLTLAQRSAGQVPAPGTAVFLADSLGEMAHWYAIAGATLIGGTFAERGGHTPFEPAAQGSAILHGPSVANFAEPFALLDAEGGAVALRGPADLAGALEALDAPRQATLAAQAKRLLAVDGNEGAFVRAFFNILPGAPQVRG